MSPPRIKESQRQIMLVNYTKTGEIPEGFYVKEMKDGRVQFRRVKQPLGIEDYRRKIENYQKKISELQKLISEFESNNNTDV